MLHVLLLSRRLLPFCPLWPKLSVLSGYLLPKPPVIPRRATERLLTRIAALHLKANRLPVPALRQLLL